MNRPEENAIDNGGQSAYPLFVRPGDMNQGLTKREHFSALALQGLISNPSIPGAVANGRDPADAFATAAVKAADALLRALEEEVNP